ncbi:MAG: hypothetical protein M3349_01105 [Actinomycetota bacterium]|nr:hypothetical protein [Actinomycetota bacterium]
MRSSGSTSSTLHMLVVDPAAVVSFDDETRHRFRDRIGAWRPQVVVVSLDGASAAELPEPDYLVTDDGTLITRIGTDEQASGWPPDDPDAAPTTVDEAAAVAWLADSLMIPPSAVIAVVVPGRLGLEPPDGWAVIQVGDGEAPSGASTVMPAEGSQLMEAVDAALGGGPSAGAGDITDTAFEQAVLSLRRNITDLGFTAASMVDNVFMDHDANYAAVWARDGVMTGLWAMALDDPELDGAFRRTLELLARHQAISGQIPAYVRIDGEQPDYSGIGGIASIDSVLWFVTGTARYAFHRRDRDFAKAMLPAVEKAMVWLAAHDSNNDGLLEVPESSDWMDLFPRSYNVLYDEVLWYQACLDCAALCEALTGDPGRWRDMAEAVQRRIVDVFWPTGRQLMELAGSTSGRFSTGEARYLLSQVTPFDYSWRCDVLANLLASLCGLLDEAKQQRVFHFLWGVGINQPYPVACIYPPIHSGADDWKDYFIVNFMNLPDHYHNGGAWPFIGGLWVRFLHEIGREELAHLELTSLAEACRLGLYGEWEFNEWLHGRTGRPMGKAHQAWSAAAYIQAYLIVRKGVAPVDLGPLDPADLAP